LTVPSDRIAHGIHSFHFRGLHAKGTDRPPLPLLPVSLRAAPPQTA
jgi:hypothetical protein